MDPGLRKRTSLSRMAGQVYSWQPCMPCPAPSHPVLDNGRVVRSVQVLRTVQMLSWAREKEAWQ